MASPGAATGKVHVVTMAGTRYEPASLDIRPGDTVIWKNRDIVPHTATARNGAFDSGSIAPGASWKYRPKAVGIFPYFCVFHPTMTGTLRVE